MTSKQRAVLRALCDLADADGHYQGGFPALAAQADCTVRTVSSAMQAHLDAGRVVLVEPARGTSAALYRLVVPRMDDLKSRLARLEAEYARLKRQLKEISGGDTK